MCRGYSKVMLRFAWFSHFSVCYLGKGAIHKNTRLDSSKMYVGNKCLSLLLNMRQTPEYPTHPTFLGLGLGLRLGLGLVIGLGLGIVMGLGLEIRGLG